MSSEKVDKTKQNIGVGNLADKEKKDLFDKFVQAGGKVLKEGKAKGVANYDRSKQKGRVRTEISGQNAQKQAPAAPPRRDAKTIPVKKPGPPAQSVRKRGPLTVFFETLHIRLRLWFMGVTDFYGFYFKRGFLEKFESEVKTAIQDIQLLFLDIFRQNPRTGATITTELDKANPLYFELMEMTGGIFDRTLMNKITGNFVNFPEVPQKVKDLQEPLSVLFKKLYVLRRYQEYALYAFERAITHQMRIEKGKASIYSYKRRKVKNSIYIVFQRFYTRLFWLACHFQGMLLPASGPEIEKLFGITAEEWPGRRERMKLAAEKKQASGGTEEPEGESADREALPETESKGLEIMYRLDLAELRARYDEGGAFQNVKDNDKILMAYLLFREFDSEYSFILTTNKIKYNIQFTQEGKVDFKAKMTDLYNELRSCMNVFRDYADMLGAYEKLRKEKPSSSAQYMEYSNRLTAADKKRNTVGKNVRMTVRAFMERAEEVLKILAADMEGQQKIIQNPQEQLSFESGIEGSKKMEGKKVYEAVSAAWYYSSAFIHRLSPDGDLHGDLEFKEEEMKKMRERRAEQIDRESTMEAEKKIAAAGKEASADQEDKGVIKELEDLF
jgi:hypothetical protein